MAQERKKERLDLALLQRGLAESREKAQAYIMEGAVYINGVRAQKASQKVNVQDQIDLKMVQEPFASRGGFKLQGALDYFGVDVSQKIALDAGSSTGGFTDCLLKRGARKVYALDVGYGLLDWKLRNDPRIVLKERSNVRYIKPGDIPDKIDIMTVDLSFISLKKVLLPLKMVLEKGEMLLLVKPQFEVGRKHVGKGGIVKDPQKQKWAIEEIAFFCLEQEIRIMGIMESPIRGAEGNREFFIHASLCEESLSRDEISHLIERIVYEKG
jgi:23S rRNA (cytidine1920-2'-O)/16S rRNA (cytidine1409-2'-O)-methyltransferase